MKDNVNHPEHYTNDPSGIECIDVTRHRDFNIGNAIKYLWRAGRKSDAAMEKNEKTIEDLRKAIFYIKDEIKLLGGSLSAETNKAIGPSEKEVTDGIYLISDRGEDLYTGRAINENATYTGVGVKLGNKSLIVALNDMTEDEITLTTEKGGTRFISNYHDAVADWNGKENTEDIRNTLNPDIELATGEYIPSLGELYFILLHIRDINTALVAIGGKPLCGWYWSSTEYSASYAWGLGLHNGIANGYAKATGQGRVRAVSAFLPSTVNL